jgi:hypothetical protein
MAEAGTSPRYWRAIVGAIIVLVVIVGVAGIVAFRERDDDSATAATTTTTTVPLTSEWFGARTGESCAEVRAWFGAVITAVMALEKKQPWADAQADILSARRDARQAYLALAAMGTGEAKN